MYYRKAVRAAGLDPDNIRNAEAEDEFIIRIGVNELRGAVIGDPMKCSGARACKKQRGASFVWVGAVRAIVGYPNGVLIRFKHNGQISKTQDRGMFPVGVYKFSRIPVYDLPGRHQQRAGGKSLAIKTSRGLREGISFHPERSLAAQMRRGAEVELD